MRAPRRPSALIPASRTSPTRNSKISHHNVGHERTFASPDERVNPRDDSLTGEDPSCQFVLPSDAHSFDDGGSPMRHRSNMTIAAMVLAANAAAYAAPAV